MLPFQTNRYGDLLKEFYEGVKNNNLPESRMTDIQNIFNELWMRDEKYFSFLRTQDNKIGPASLDLPFFPIYNEVLAIDKTSIEILAPLPSNTKQIIVWATGRFNGTGGSPVCSLQARFNGDSGANYNSQFIQAQNTTVSANRFTGVTVLPMGTMAADGEAAGVNSTSIHFLSHIKTSLFKNALSFVGSNFSLLRISSGEWQDTGEIQSITFLPDTATFPSAKFEAGFLITVFVVT